MQQVYVAEDFRKIADLLESISEADKKDSNDQEASKDTASDQEDKSTEDDTNSDQISTDKAVDDVMTKEKEPEKLTGTVSINTLAADLGIRNLGTFTKAFNQLRRGKMPTNTDQVKELAIAFDKLLAADASTTSRVLNRLRQIHKIKDSSSPD